MHAPFDTDLNYTYLDELPDGQRWSTWSSVVKSAHGPEPRPDWVITDDGAIDTELGVLKTGKEADVFLVERAVPDVTGTSSSLLAAKRYRSADHRQFHRDSSYTEGRRVRRSRDARAMAKGTAYGRQASAGQWAQHEFAALSSLWSAGVPVPYPVQIDGTEILMEFIDVEAARDEPRADVAAVPQQELGAVGVSHDVEHLRQVDDHEPVALHQHVVR